MPSLKQALASCAKLGQHQRSENERDERNRKYMIRFLKDKIDEIEELNEELDNPGMFIDDEEWEKEMDR